MYKIFWISGKIVPDEGNWHVENGVVVGGDENPAIVYNLLLDEGRNWLKGC